MDGGQVALSADGKTEFNAWMSDEGGKRRLFFAAVKPGEAPAGAGLVDLAGQQTHPVITALPDGRALVVFESSESVGVAVLKQDGTVELKQMLAKAGRFPRLVQCSDSVVVAWESSDGIQSCRIDQNWWAAKTD
jgi:hypothetical protein